MTERILFETIPDPYTLRASIGRPVSKATLLYQTLARQVKKPVNYFRPGILATSRWSHDRVTTPIVDLSQYNYSVDFALLKKAGVKAVILRSGVGGSWEDPTFATRCQQAYNNDLAVMVYHVYVPGLSDNKPGNTSLHIKLMQKILANKQYYAIFIDNEIYKDAGGNVISPFWLEDWCHDLIDSTIHEFGAVVNNNVGMYSGRWFIESYAPNITNWIHRYLTWMAQYPYAAGSVETTWEELDAKYYPPEDMKIWTPGVVSQLDILQFSGDKFKLPGIYANAQGALGAVDLNMAFLPYAAFCEKYHYSPQSDPTPPPSGDTNPPSGGTEQPPASDGGMDAEAKEYLRRIMVAAEKLANIIK